MSGIRRVAIAVVAALLVATVAVTLPAKPAVAAPSNYLNLYLPYWAEGHGVLPDGTGELSKVFFYPFYYGVAQSKIHYQGTEANPGKLPPVGTRFYMHVSLNLANGIVPTNSAEFSLRLLLPTGLSLAVNSNTDVYCTRTNEAYQITDFSSSWCGDPTPFGAYQQFPNATVHGGEIIHYWFPVIASKSTAQGLGEVQFLAQQLTNNVGQLPNPVISAITPTVLASAGASLPSATAPGAPQAVSAAATNGGASVSWSAPASDGGSAISGYRANAYTSAAGSTLAGSCTTTGARTCSIAGLVNGATYYVDVRATNGAGTGSPSGRVAVTPVAPPPAPSGVVVNGVNSSVFVSWNAPVTTTPITGYRVDVFTGPTGGTSVGSCSTTGALGCTVTGLVAGGGYYAEVRSRSSVGDSAPSARALGLAGVVPSGGGEFIPRNPFRTLDTRRSGQGPCVAGGTTRNLTVAGEFGVPLNAASVVVNVTVVNPTAPGYLTVFPAGTTRPTASNLNFTAGQVVANGVTVGVGSSGQISLFVNSGCADVLVDLIGFHTSGTTITGGFVPINPNRVIDTRQVTGGGCIVGGTSRDITVTSPIPGGAAGAVVLNVTVVAPTAGGYLTVYPTGENRPTASNLNFSAGQIVANSAVVKVGAGGKVTVFVNSGCAHVLIDVAGYTKPGAAAAGGYTGITPTRRLDTRQPPPGACVPGGTVRDVPVAGLGSVPANAYTVTVNVTVVAPTTAGYVTVFPTGDPRPTASTLNFQTQQVVANATTARVGQNGSISVFVNNGCAHVLVDVVGYTSVPG